MVVRNYERNDVVGILDLRVSRALREIDQAFRRVDMICAFEPLDILTNCCICVCCRMSERQLSVENISERRSRLHPRVRYRGQLSHT